jgi:uncharacterized protein (UPF0548 family)
MFFLLRPSPQRIDRFLDAARQLPLSYAPIGLAERAGEGFSVDEHVAVVGSGGATFARAAAVLAEWRHFDVGWVELFPKRAPIAPGTVVAVLAHHVGLWSLNGCRVVYTIWTPAGPTFGFAYGTLTDHAETGEELFEITCRPETGEISYRVRAVSRQRAVLAKLGSPVARALQRRFRRDSARALARAIAG